MWKKIMCVIWVPLLLLAFPVPAQEEQAAAGQAQEEQAADGQAQEEQVRMQIISCPGQGFSTLCREEYSQSYTPDGGVTIFLEQEDKRPFVSIFKTDAPGSGFDAEYYFNNVYPELLESTYGDALISVGQYSVYSLSGREMPGRMAEYLDINDGEICARFCAYDLRDDCFVRYEAFCEDYDAILEKTLTALAVAVGNFKPDPEYYGSLAQDAGGSLDNDTDTEPEQPSGSLFPGFDMNMGP